MNKGIWEENPFHEVHYANETLWQIAEVIRRQPWDTLAVKKIVGILEGVGYNVDPLMPSKSEGTSQNA